MYSQYGSGLKKWKDIHTLTLKTMVKNRFYQNSQQYIQFSRFLSHKGSFLFALMSLNHVDEMHLLSIDCGHPNLWLLGH